MAKYGKIWQNVAYYGKILHLLSVKSRRAPTISDFHCSNDQNNVIKLLFIFVLQNVLSCLKLVLLTHNTILHNNNGALCLKLIFVVCCAHPVMT